MEKFSSIEDKLLKKYWENNPGVLFKEVEVRGIKNRKRARRIDAILVLKEEKEIYSGNDFNLEELKREVKENPIEIIEVKRELNRDVIGQVEVAAYLADNNFNLKEASPVIVCGKSHPDLEEYCNYKNIKVSVFESLGNNSSNLSSEENKLNLLMKNPQSLFHTQDLALLWDVENKNTLYTTIKRYVKKGILIRIHKGFYSKVPLEQINPVKLGMGFLHSFCYLSVESILTREGVISQYIPYITLISNKSKRFEIKGNFYISRQMKDEFLFNGAGIIEKNGIKKATLERAVADMIYYNPKCHFDGPNLVDWKKVNEIQQSVGFKRGSYRKEIKELS